jgi:hypothetical protein
LASTREKTGKCGCALKLILTALPGGGVAGSEVVKMVLVIVTRSSALSSAAWASASGDTAGCWVACSSRVLVLVE